jgi:hypothetical protein
MEMVISLYTPFLMNVTTIEQCLGTMAFPWNDILSTLMGSRSSIFIFNIKNITCYVFMQWIPKHIEGTMYSYYIVIEQKN